MLVRAAGAQLRAGAGTLGGSEVKVLGSEVCGSLQGPLQAEKARLTLRYNDPPHSEPLHRH